MARRSQAAESVDVHASLLTSVLGDALDGHGVTSVIGVVSDDDPLPATLSVLQIAAEWSKTVTQPVVYNQAVQVWHCHIACSGGRVPTVAPRHSLPPHVSSVVGT